MQREEADSSVGDTQAGVGGVDALLQAAAGRGVCGRGTKAGKAEKMEVKGGLLGGQLQGSRGGRGGDP